MHSCISRPARTHSQWHARAPMRAVTSSAMFSFGAPFTAPLTASAACSSTDAHRCGLLRRKLRGCRAQGNTAARTACCRKIISAHNQTDQLCFLNKFPGLGTSPAAEQYIKSHQAYAWPAICSHDDVGGLHHAPLQVSRKRCSSNELHQLSSVMSTPTCCALRGATGLGRCRPAGNTVPATAVRCICQVFILASQLLPLTDKLEVRSVAIHQKGLAWSRAPCERGLPRASSTCTSCFRFAASVLSRFETPRHRRHQRAITSCFKTCVADSLLQRVGKRTRLGCRCIATSLEAEVGLVLHGMAAAMLLGGSSVAYAASRRSCGSSMVLLAVCPARSATAVFMPRDCALRAGRSSDSTFLHLAVADL